MNDLKEGFNDNSPDYANDHFGPKACYCFIWPSIFPIKTRYSIRIAYEGFTDQGENVTGNSKW